MLINHIAVELVLQNMTWNRRQGSNGPRRLLVFARVAVALDPQLSLDIMGRTTPLGAYGLQSAG
ncbi:hypothetical protein I7I51_00744 [Histoplasma capsulatum]|uniref:Uncharacterized protein n=1 Tax=Ajellomyces capsulatus TaxID=5037 RepID=A0A8A1MCW3_AJECA|nr:hypothetical protein I7I51_00744 [Histoplasma capsulatum]